MATALRRVKKLTLNAKMEEHVSAAKNLLEDAFKTATFAGIPESRLIIVKRLYLEKLNIDLPASNISYQISERFNQQLGSARPMKDGEVPEGDIVWFPDSLTPYVMLIERILNNKSCHHWVWKLAVREYDINAGREENLLILIQSDVFRGDDGFALSNLIRHLILRNSLDKLLVWLDEENTEQFLRGDAQVIHLVQKHKLETLSRAIAQDRSNSGNIESGVQNDHSTQKNANSLINNLLRHGLSLNDKTLLNKWMTHWGRGDVRSFFLTYYLLVANNPSVRENSKMVSQLLQSLDTFSQSAKPGAAKEFSDTPSHHVINNNESIDHSDYSSLDSPTDKTDKNAKRSDPSNFVGNHNNTTIDIEEETHASESSSWKVNSAELKRIENHDQLKSETVDTHHQKKTLSESMSFIDADNTKSSNQQVEITNNGPVETVGIFSNSLGFVSYPNAGVAYLIRLMDMLSMSALVQNSDLLAENNFPLRVLQHLLKRYLGEESADLLSEFPLLNFPPSTETIDIIIPESWDCLLVHDNPMKLIRYEDYPDVTTLQDARGLLIAQWHGDMPQKVQHIVGRREVITKELKSAPIDCQQMLHQFHIAIVRFLRKYVRVPLLRIIKKSGFVASSMTHLDFKFNGRLVDVRLRRTGMDISPGWLPWLGKVVSIHYDFEQDEHYVG